MPEPWLRAAVPRVRASSRKVTVPVAVEGVTVAVSVIDWPTVEGLGEETSAVEVAIGLTTWLRMLDVLPASLPSPP